MINNNNGFSEEYNRQLRVRRENFLRKENAARDQPGYNPDDMKYVNQGALTNWGADEIDSVFAEVQSTMPEVAPDDTV